MAAAFIDVDVVIERGRREAHQDGAEAVEAHHLLLALAGADDPVVRGVLDAAGLDRAAVRAALDRENARSLAAIGVDVAAFTLPAASVAGDPPSRLGTSARLALERGFASVGRKKDLRPGHLLRGVLLAEVGTVPRALALGGVDRAGLLAALDRALAAAR
ncbi:Clp protease N-terminal domain-containing protein [Spongiactinospora sp. TRM90649]|uniref:Clp protease N-terminal domain-containing protein n=1 Tax=Spongiactinospora sp. TRM90649 TaxID=3031114 RepID=UPI0023F7FB15|nr:Clp protease N-terminal domain-containing protein [Spongiactinospora sp. TRM90649]